MSAHRSSTTIATVLVVLSLSGCGKDGQPGASGSTSSSSSVASTGPSTAMASVSASATTASSTNPNDGSAAGATAVVGAYDAKLATVRTPTDAPKFDDVAAGGIGAGEIALSLPAGDGEVTGKTSGALGAQAFRGQLEAGWLSGVLQGEGEGATWGYLDATVSGVGEARVVAGTLRVSSGDGRIVRESAFTLKKK